MGNYRFILSGGGTGGHIYPAIAIANELKARHPEAAFLFVGARDRMEMEKVPQAGYKIEGLWISGLQRKISFKNLLFPFKVINSLMRARRIIKKFKPDVVIGTGGFASGPVLRSAASFGIPSVIQEQNSYAGLTNKLLAKKTNKICVAYENMDRFFPKEKLVMTGNPVRKNLTLMDGHKEEATSFFGLDPMKRTLLILGGSLGSARINELIGEKLEFFTKLEIQLIWQCGKGYYNKYAGHQSDNVKVYDFLNRMDLAYAQADVIISRAGASSVSELCIVGKPVIFIPSPNVAEDHQTKNARALAAKDAAILIAESDLEAQFDEVFSSLMDSDTQRSKLGANIKELALPNATEHIVNVIESLIES